MNNKVGPNICCEGKSPLYSASRHGHTGIIELLLNNKADPNICCEGKSPLYAASRNGYTQIMKLLLKSGVNITIDTNAPLYVSVKAGNTDVVSILLENNCFELRQYDTFHQSPLFIASSKGDLQIVELLLKYNFDPNICSINCLSPLFMASKRGHVEIVKLLLENGSYPKICDKYGQSPLCIASRKRHLTVVELLLQYRSDPLFCNINGFSPITVSLLNTGRKINEQIVILLLNHCVKLSEITENECSFVIAVLDGESRALNDVDGTVLHGDSTTLNDIEGNALHGDSGALDDIEDTVLHEVSGALYNTEGKAMFSKLLISGYVSSLFVATCCHSATLVKMLLTQIRSENSLCNTSLIAACMYGYQEIVTLLLENGCDPNESTKYVLYVRRQNMAMHILLNYYLSIILILIFLIKTICRLYLLLQVSIIQK